ncbi:SDR family NAD(P)-dependent oxidoreductase, partial [Amycolatopsis sp. NPDC051061]|uniref:SDR family NAD(P)-dependent oxidoreductase n=1 Tax=Amycolatopsis sp. NPDC051061 TaxID=3155042 RepID=UPI00341F6D83
TTNWTTIFAGSHARPVPLPTYAFQHKHYWLTPIERPAAVADAEFWDAVDSGDVDTLAGSLGVATTALEPVLPGLTSWRARNRDSSTVDDWAYRIEWEPIAAPTGELSGTWLVVSPARLAKDQTVLGVLNTLTAWGASPRLVHSAEEFTGPGPDAVLSLLAWDDRATGTGTTSHGVTATVALVQAAERLGWTAPLWCVTRGAVAVREPSEVTSEFQPQVWGTGIVLSLDLPETWGGLIDLPTNPDVTDLDRLCAVLTNADHEDQTAVRASIVFARRMRRQAITSAPAWRPSGTVLVTGGTGGLGGYVGRWAAEQGAEHVVLLSRQGQDAPGADTLAEEIVGAGARCSVVACDVTDRDAVAAVLAELPGAEPLSVVHAAGVALPSKPLAELNEEEFTAIGRAKVAGAQALDELLTGREVDAFVLFSSGAAAWGSGGQSAYAAGNAYLDGLAQRRAARGLPATAVAWGAWGGGIGTIDEVMGEQWRRAGLLTMNPRLATLALAHAVGSGAATTVVADIDWARFAPAYALARPRPLLAALPEVTEILGSDDSAEDTGTAELAARLVGLAPTEQEHLLSERIQVEAAAVLGLADAAATGDRAFREIGFDSLTAVELRNRLNAATGQRLPATLVFDHPTPSVLARHLRTLLAASSEASAAPVDSVEAVLAELDRWEAAIPTLPTEQMDRSHLAARLQRLGTRVGELVAAGDSAADLSVTEQLDDAGAEDVFAFIDREFGDE